MAIEAAGEKLFGEIAVEWGFVEPAYLARAEQVQRNLLAQGQQRRLGEILMESGAMSKPQALKVLKEVKKRQGMKPRIGGYEIQEKIGQGGMGVVYRAKQVSMDRDIALKLLPRHLADDATFVERFLREARTSARLNHRNIVAAIDVGEAGGYYYFAMEYIDGQPFDRVLEERGCIPEPELLPFAIQIVNGLEHAAQNGITHRDIKPGNLMLCRDGMVKIADMGLAVAESAAAAGVPSGTDEDDDLPHSASRAGTPYYMAPEQVEGTGPFDFRTDFYALGASLFEMATGKKPFDGSSAQAIMAKRLYENPPVAREANPSVGKGFSAVIHKLMQREPDGRYADFPSLLADLDAVLHRRRPAALREFVAHTQGTTITMPRLRHRRTKHSLARRALTWAGSILFLLVCGGFTFAMLFKEHLKGPQHPDPTQADVRWELIETAAVPGTGAHARARWIEARNAQGAYHQLRLPNEQDRARVRAAFEAVRQEFPGTVYARMAEVRLRDF